MRRRYAFVLAVLFPTLAHAGDAAPTPPPATSPPATQPPATSPPPEAAPEPAAADAATTARWIRQVLDRQIPLPKPIANQLACCLVASGYTEDLCQAKAVVAVETNGRSAAAA